VGGMTYFGSQAVLAIPAERLRHPTLAPAVHRVSHGGLRPRQDGRSISSHPKKQNPSSKSATGFFFFRSLAMTYSHMGNPHTTIGDVTFHFRVRDGVGWFHYSMVARQTGLE
jgi:hypothetical protein